MSKFFLLIPLILFLLAWQAYGGSSDERSFFYSTPQKVAEVFWDDLIHGDLLRNMAITGGEALGGFLIGNIVGAIIGISLWYSDVIARISKPYLAALGAFPVFAIAPMTILWFGISIWAKIVLAFLATVFLALGQAFRGVEQVDPRLLKRFQLLESSRWATFRYLLAPTALVWVFGSLRITIGSSLLGAFIGEFIASDCGLGYMIIRASGLYDTPRVIVGVLMIVLMATCLDLGVSRIEKHFLSWKSITD
tara:strand:- start:17266 stop:18015 length:750 start_codon:yes stop_codon:yes gene_type:complete